PNRAQVIALLIIERRVLEDVRHADHARERRADLMTHHREKRALRLVRQRGLGRESVGACDGRLQLLVHLLDRTHCQTKVAFDLLLPGDELTEYQNASNAAVLVVPGLENPARP